MDMMTSRRQPALRDVEEYWDTHLNLTQFLEADVEVGSDQFYELLRAQLSRYEYKLALLEEFARECNGQELLEIGCGLGPELAELGRLGFVVTGIDLAPNAVRVCNEYLAKQGVEGQALVQNAECLEFPDDTFDAVYSSGVLQHTPSIERAIAELWRVLKPGGRILIILYHRRSWFYLLHRVSGMNVEFASDDAPIINAYTRNELESLFSRFRNLQIRCEYCYPNPTGRRGLLATLYNRVFVPVMRTIPKGLISRYGWHLILTAQK
jgi:ubiquinone/menaquinone biosynthesis C-methylase UbiE